MSHKNEQYRYRQRMFFFFFLFLHYSSCTLWITASLPLPLFLSLMFVSPFLLPWTFPFSFISFLLYERNSSSSMCQRGLSNNRSFYWTFCELSGWGCMNNTCGDPLTSPSLLKESIFIPPNPILQALAPFSAHCYRLWGMRRPYHRPVEEDWDLGKELYITFFLVKRMLMWLAGSPFLGLNKWFQVIYCSLVQGFITWPTL